MTEPPNFSFCHLASGEDAGQSDLFWSPGLAKYLPSHSAHWQVQPSAICDRMFATVASEHLMAISESIQETVSVCWGPLKPLGRQGRFSNLKSRCLPLCMCFKTLWPAGPIWGLFNLQGTTLLFVLAVSKPAALLKYRWRAKVEFSCSSGV